MKNFVFISPNFPTNYWKFCAELKKNGMNVLGIGDCPYDQLMPELRGALNEYYKVSSLENYDEVYSEDSYDDSDSAYDDEELGGRSPLFRPSEATQSRSFEKKRSSIAENFERKQVNPNSPYQKARTMQFKAQHDVPIYTNPADQIPLGGSAPSDAAPAAGSTTAYEGTHAGTTSNTASFGTRSNTFSTPPVNDTAEAAPEAPASTYRGSHEASSPEEARNLGDSTFRSSRPAAPAPKPAAPAPKNREDKIASASVDELLAMIEDEKKKL